jgi:acyl-CoA synthetase (AMP-forming)/AMP-acid ligase II
MRVIDFFDKGCALGEDAPLFVTLDGVETSYGRMQEWSRRIAAAMAAVGATAPHVGIWAPNDPLAFAPWVGALRAGGCWVPINSRNLPEVNIEFMNTAEVDWLFYHSQFADVVPRVKAEAPTVKHFVCLDREDGEHPSLARFCAEHGTGAVPDVPEDRDRIVGIVSTGGTTARSKGVVHTNLCWETMIASGWHAMPVEGRPVHLLAAPMTHAAGILAFVLAPGGAKNVILDKVDPLLLMQAIDEFRVTHLFLPPTALYSMLAHPEVRNFDYSSLRYLLVSAAPVSPEKFKEAVEVFGPCVCQVWAQAESPFFLTWLPPSAVARAARDPAYAHHLKSCGREFMLSRVAVLDDDNREVPLGERGELCMQGNLRMLEYYKNPAATAEIRDAAGWQHTGDIGYRDADGYFYIVDRKKDMIVTGGFNVFSAEVEAALNAHPAVRDCAVYGVPHEKWGEAVHASVELKEGASATLEELMAFARERLGGTKTPKSIDLIAALPRSPVGKILKRVLRDKHWAGRDRAVG